MFQKNKVCFVSIDVESDLRKESFEGVESLDNILSLFKKYDISATLFFTGQVLERYKELAKQLVQNYEIACHGFTHKFWNELTFEQRKKEIQDFISLYQSLFNNPLIGFRAPSHIIDKDGLKLIKDSNFLYDASILPHYPPFKKYRGYKGRAPLSPYYFKETVLFEIPNTGQLMGIPLAGTWIRKLPLFVYKILFLLHQPKFITLSLHSWDSLCPQTLKKLEEIIKILKKNNYTFLNGRQIYENRK
jgi:peptidoglycan/xylan/chitin deacetylase (PgdA/CDA1 family)